MSDLQDIIHAMQDPRLRHAAVVHFPVALSAIGAPLGLTMLALGLLLERRPDLARAFRVTRLTYVAWFSALAASAFVAAQAGDGAFAKIGELSTAARATLERHEAMAELAWLWALAALVPALVTWSPKPWLRRTGLGGCAAAAAFLATWFGLIGHLGGTAVHRFGAGYATIEREALPPDAKSADPRADFFSRLRAPSSPKTA